MLEGERKQEIKKERKGKEEKKQRVTRVFRLGSKFVHPGPSLGCRFPWGGVLLKIKNGGGGGRGPVWTGGLLEWGAFDSL